MHEAVPGGQGIGDPRDILLFLLIQKVKIIILKLGPDLFGFRCGGQAGPAGRQYSPQENQKAQDHTGFYESEVQ
jgi:hypothetical protein